MSMSDRRLSLGLGLLFLAGFALSFRRSLAVVADDPASLVSIGTVAAGALMLFGSVAFVLAGLSPRLSVGGRTLEWWQLRSVGFVAIGLYLAISGLLTVTSLVGIAMLVGGIGVAVFGSQQLRTGPRTDSATEAA